jgi:diphosphomevalonate decarboxylase
MFPSALISLNPDRLLEASATAPSNIAFIKYWGKKGHQLPANASLSMTLKACVTHTKLVMNPAGELRVKLFLEGLTRPDFAVKVQRYLFSLSQSLPWLRNYDFEIHTENTFPHSSGIASSASSQAALALCLGKVFAQLQASDLDWHLVGQLARLGSGSACRSLFAGFVSWGETSLIPGSSDLYATDINAHVHESLRMLRDTVLIVSTQTKEVSSREGHAQMQQHPFYQARLTQAQTHMSQMLSALGSGDWQVVGEIMESEALTLHALMMTSHSGYILLLPGSLEIIQLVRAFRRESGVPVYFTIDAGPNIHIIYPDTFHAKVEAFVRHELFRFTVSGAGVIWDSIGIGAR